MLHVFDNWASDEIKTADDLAKQTGAEELLIGTPSKISPVITTHRSLPFCIRRSTELLLPIAARIMRALVGIQFCEEKAENTYGHSTLSRELIDPNFRIIFVGMYVPRKSVHNSLCNVVYGK